MKYIFFALIMSLSLFGCGDKDSSDLTEDSRIKLDISIGNGHGGYASSQVYKQKEFDIKPMKRELIHKQVK